MDSTPDLRALVRDAARRYGGYRELADRSRGLVSASTLNAIATGRHGGRLKPSSVRGIADCLGLPAAEVAAIAGTELADDRRRFVLPSRADALTTPQRRVVLAVVDAIITAGSGRPERRGVGHDGPYGYAQPGE